jgi:MFS family permease
MAISQTSRTHDVARVGALLFAVGWGTNHIVPLLLVYRARLGLTAIDLGTLFAVYALGLTPALLIGGPLSDKHGRRRVVLTGAVLALAGTALLAAGANGFALLAVGRFVVGLGSGAVFSAGTAWVQDLSADAPPGTGARRATIALSCGFGGGPLIAAICAQWFARPLFVPYLVQAAALVGALALAAKAPGGPRHAPVGAPTPTPESASLLPAGFFSEVGIIAPWVFAFPSIAFVVLPAAVRAHLGGYAVAYAGLVPAVCLGTGILLQPVARPRPARRVAVAGLLAGALGLLGGRVAGAIGSPALVLGAVVLLGVGYGACLIAGLRWIEATVPAARRGRATGVFYVLTYLGFWTPTLLAALSRAIGESATFSVAVALALATAIATGARPWRSDRGGARHGESRSDAPVK